MERFTNEVKNTAAVLYICNIPRITHGSRSNRIHGPEGHILLQYVIPLGGVIRCIPGGHPAGNGVGLVILTFLSEELTITAPPDMTCGTPRWVIRLFSLARTGRAGLATLEDHFNGHGRVRLRGKTIGFSSHRGKKVCSDDPVRMILQPLRHKFRFRRPDERNSLMHFVNDREDIVFRNLLGEGKFLLHVPVSQSRVNIPAR